MRDASPDIHTVRVGDVELPVKLGARGHPAPPTGWKLLLGPAREARGDVLDASGTGGLAARAGRGGTWTVLEPSAAALACLRARPPGGAEVVAGLPWDAPAAGVDVAFLVPPADRGHARVRAELAAAARAVRPGGEAWLLFHKDRGGKRYERDAGDTIGPVDVRARSAGWRLSCATRAAGAAGGVDGVAWSSYEAAGLRVWSLPGVFSARALDRGTAALLSALEATEARTWPGREVLDLGSGSGVLAAWSARRGACVTAVDDDLAAVRSTERTLAEVTEAEPARVVHGDLDAGWPEAFRFDRIVCNPPFHVGPGVRTALSEAFVAAAHRRLRPGGEAWWVVNSALPYERWLTATFARVEQVSNAAGFTVWRAAA